MTKVYIVRHMTVTLGVFTDRGIAYRFRNEVLTSATVDGPFEVDLYVPKKYRVDLDITPNGNSWHVRVFQEGDVERTLMYHNHYAKTFIVDSPSETEAISKAQARYAHELAI